MLVKILKDITIAPDCRTTVTFQKDQIEEVKTPLGERLIELQAAKLVENNDLEVKAEDEEEKDEDEEEGEKALPILSNKGLFKTKTKKKK